MQNLQNEMKLLQLNVVAINAEEVRFPFDCNRVLFHRKLVFLRTLHLSYFWIPPNCSAPISAQMQIIPFPLSPFPLANSLLPFPTQPFPLDKTWISRRRRRRIEPKISWPEPISEVHLCMEPPDWFSSLILSNLSFLLCKFLLSGSEFLLSKITFLFWHFFKSEKM